MSASSSRFNAPPAQWPLWLAATAVVTGVAMLAFGAWGFRQAERMTAETPQASASTSPELATVQTAITSELPQATSYGSDVRSVLKLAHERQLTLGAVDYGSEVDTPADAQARRINLHVESEYPKIKAFLAGVQESLPHSRLDSLELAQTGQPPSSHLHGTITFTLWYRSAEAHARISAGGAP